jgi:two-component system, cell cycle sensor histidine kinase and response regulator CckA
MLMNASDERDQFFELSQDLLCVIDFDGRIVEVSQFWETLTDYSAEDLKSHPLADFLNPEDVDKTASTFASLARESNTAKLVNRCRARDGSDIWLRWSLSSSTASRRIYGVASVIAESSAVVTEDLRRTNHILNSIISACPHAIISVDARRNLRIWNPAAERMFGWTSEEVVGGRVPFVTDAQRNESNDFNERALNGETFTNYELQRARRDGTILELLVSAAPTYDDKGLIDGFLTVATDVTAQKNLERQLLRTQRLESVGSLASGIAHDLNNVLAPIRMALDLFREKLHDPASQRTLETLEGCVGRGANLIKHVLTFARGVEGERVPVQLRHLIKETEDVVSQTMPKSVTMTTDVSKDLWAMSADTTQIHQVLMNLVLNARDAMPEGGTLKITAKNIVVDESGVPQNPHATPGPYVFIEVLDTGTGIPPEIHRKVFEPFFTTKELGGGTGLGLSTVAAIVRNHGGFINLYSEVGRGTSFKIYLPALENQTDIEDVAVPELPPMGTGEMILLVDDEAAVRDIAKLTLETHGYKVVEAQDGAEGVAVFAMHRNEIRLVVSDMDMPVMNGASMIRSLERIDPSILVISASGLVVGQTEDGQLPCMRRQLRKPYTAGELLHAVHDVLSMV